MGWDVVQIGLKHNLPVHDMVAFGTELQKRTKHNIRLVAANLFMYSKRKNRISFSDKNEDIEIMCISSPEYESQIDVEVVNYQARKMKSDLGKAFSTVKFKGRVTKQSFNYYLKDNYDLYKICKQNLFIDFFEENIYLDVNINARYGGWESRFHSQDRESREWLIDCRNSIQERARLFGCQKILVCCDQGPTMEIFDRMNMKADALLEYSKSHKYNEDQTYMDSVEDWKDYERQIDFQDYFDDKLKLDDNDFVSVVYDNVEY